MQHLTLFSCILASLSTICTGADWCYQSQFSCEQQCNGPDKWDHASSKCNGRSQSPINIVHRKTEIDDRLSPFQFSNYQHSFKSVIKNNGHSVQVGVPHLATITGGNLGTEYKAVQFHLHWGENGGPGSEHTVDGEQFPMELHIVHMKSKYTDLVKALDDKEGVAVLGFFYEESNSANRKYEPLVNALKAIQTTGSNTSMSQISLEQLIPSEQSLTNYYRYQGSLTTPGCHEAVVWTVFEKPIPLSKAQLKAFSDLKFKSGQSMVGTFRPVQPLNGRTVYRSGGPVLMASVALLLASVTMALGLPQYN